MIPINRVTAVRKKSEKKQFFSRSGKSQGKCHFYFKISEKSANFNFLLPAMSDKNFQCFQLFVCGFIAEGFIIHGQ